MKTLNLDIIMTDEEFDLLQKLIQPIDDCLNLSTRTANACKFNDKVLLGDVCRADYNRMLKYHRFGKVCATELITQLNNNNFPIGLYPKMSDRFWTIYHFYRESYMKKHKNETYS